MNFTKKHQQATAYKLKDIKDIEVKCEQKKVENYRA